MRRHLFAAFAIAGISILATGLLYEGGVLNRCAGKLVTFYANLGLIDPAAAPHRASHYLAFTLLGLITAWASLDIPHTVHKWIVVIGTMLLVTSFSLTLLPLGIFFEPFSSLLTIVTASALAAAFALTESGSRKMRLLSCLGDRVSRRTLSSLLAEPVPGLLQGRNCRVTVLCLRFFNLATLRSTLPPADLVEITAQFLRHSAEFLADRGAYLDESSPDCVRTYFGLTGDGVQHAVQACRMARELDERLTNLNHEVEGRYFHRLEYGIALASGDVTVGPYRSTYLSKLNVIGELGEYAHRLCGTNAAYGSHILVHAETYSLIRDTYAVRPMELMYDASHELMAEAYELLDLRDRLTPEDESARERFWQGVIRYREGRAEEALKIFSELQASRPEDRPLNYFINRTQARLLETSAPPEDHLPLIHGHARVLQSV